MDLYKELRKIGLTSDQCVSVIDLLEENRPTESDIDEAAENELNNNACNDWDDLISIFENGVKWVFEFQEKFDEEPVEEYNDIIDEYDGLK